MLDLRRFRFDSGAGVVVDAEAGAGVVGAAVVVDLDPPDPFLANLSPPAFDGVAIAVAADEGTVVAPLACLAANSLLACLFSLTFPSDGVGWSDVLDTVDFGFLAFLPDIGCVELDVAGKAGAEAGASVSADAAAAATSDCALSARLARLPSLGFLFACLHQYHIIQHRRGSPDIPCRILVVETQSVLPL